MKLLITHEKERKIFKAVQNSTSQKSASLVDNDAQYVGRLYIERDVCVHPLMEIFLLKKTK
jgi:hypothetical protein